MIGSLAFVQILLVLNVATLPKARICGDKTCCQREGRPIAKATPDVGARVGSILAEKTLRESEGRNRRCPRRAKLFVVSEYALASVACAGIVQVASVSEATEAAKSYSGRVLYMTLRFYEEDGELHAEMRNGEFTKTEGMIGIRRNRRGDGEKDSLYMTESEVTEHMIRTTKGGPLVCRYSSVVH
jgi:hypothetical protein